MNSNLTSHASFTYKDIIYYKLSYSVFYSVLLQLILLILFVLIVNVNLFDPLEWLLSLATVLTSISTWITIFAFIIIILAQVIICAKDYVLKPSYCSTRFQTFISFFSMRNFILLILHIIIGGSLNWLYLSLSNGPYESLTISCTNSNYCLLEGTFFLIISGFWTGLYYFIKVHISEKHLTFPVIQQRKLLQFKSSVLKLIKANLSQAIWPSIYYCIIYYVVGDQLVKSFCSFFGLTLHDSQDTVLVFLYLWLLSGLYYFCMDIIRFYYNVYLTEPVEFPLGKLTHSDSLRLQESINLSEMPIIQNLACLDLNLLAQWSPQRRTALFSLSQPGGHPHNWNRLIDNVIKLFADYTELLNKTAEGDPIKKETPPVQQKSYMVRQPQFQNLRNMSLHYDYLDVVEVRHDPLRAYFRPKMFAELRKKFNNFVEMVKLLLGINFFFGTLPEANVQKCLGNGRLIIWTSEGIAALACASLTEDPYGVVLKDLPVIITSLVQLKQALEKLNKVPALTKTRKIAGYNDFNCKMKGAVTLAVKRSLFQICATFGAYIQDFPLSKDVVQQLQTFIVCKN